MIYKMATGSPFPYSPPARPLEWRNGPLYTRTDLSFEKIFIQKGNYLATVFVQISNLFNQRDVRGGGYEPEFIRWGLDKPRPDNEQYIEFGDFDVYSRYHGSPREIKVGIRSSF